MFVLGTTEQWFQLKFDNVQRIYPENVNSTCWLYIKTNVFWSVATTRFLEVFPPTCFASGSIEI